MATASATTGKRTHGEEDKAIIPTHGSDHSGGHCLAIRLAPMPNSWWLLVVIPVGISAGLLWGGWREWGIKSFVWIVLKFALLLLAAGGLLTLCGDPGSIRGR